jgi:RND family efflux transporter MFP subunit
MSSPKPTLDDLRIERKAPAKSAPKTGMIVVALIVIIVLGGAGWWFTRTKAIPVQIVLAREVASGNGGERTVLNASGYVIARRAATVSSKYTGKVVETLVEEGMHVKQDQVLARLDDTNVKASLRVAEAQLESAKTALDETKAQLKQAELEFKRSAELAKQQIASTSVLEQAEAAAVSLRARLARQERDVTVAEREVDSWKQQLDDTIIRAPFAGVVTAKNAQPGEMISPMSAGGFTRTGICTLVDMESLEVEIDVNESFINRVVPGQPVEAALDAYPDWKIPCKVLAIIPTADRQKSTVKVRVGFDKLEPRILPEMGVKVAFREAAGNAASVSRTVVLPKGAVQRQDGRDVVLVVLNGRTERRAVAVSGTQNNEVMLSAGVSPGEKVVVDWPDGLADGAAVKEKKP